MTNSLLDMIEDTEDPEVLLEMVEELESEEDEQIDIPDRSELITDPIHLNRLNDLVEINGVTTHPALVYVVNLVATGRSPVVVIVGKEGNGKSMLALLIAHQLHAMDLCRGEFDPREQTVYRPIPFGLLLRNSTRKVIWFEEANETLNSNQYNSKMNNMVAGSIRTQRKRENIYLFSCPEFQELDPRVREKVDLMINLKQKRWAEFTIYEKKHAKRGNRGVDYFFDNNLPNWSVPDVPEELAGRYEELDNRFKGEYLDELILKAIRERIEELQEDEVTI